MELRIVEGEQMLEVLRMDAVRAQELAEVDISLLRRKFRRRPGALPNVLLRQRRGEQPVQLGPRAGQPASLGGIEAFGVVFDRQHVRLVSMQLMEEEKERLLAMCLEPSEQVLGK